MLDPGKLRGCIDGGGQLDDRSIARELASIAVYILRDPIDRMISHYLHNRILGRETRFR